MKIVSIALLTILVVSSFALASQASSRTTSFSTPYNLGQGYDPNVQSAGSNVYVAWTDKSQGIYFRSSGDNGQNWNNAIKIGAGGNYPIMSVSGSNIYVVWPSSGIMFATSSNGGVTWSKAEKISPPGGITPYIASDSSEVAVVFLVPSSGSYAIVSTDSGAHWTAPELYSNGPEPQVAVSGSNVYAVADKLDRSHVQFAVSHDSGASWTLNTNLPGGSETWIVASGSDVYATWETKSPQSVVYFLSSTNDGSTFTTREISSSMPDSWNPMINAIGSDVWVGIQEFGGKAQNWMLTSTDGGATFASDSLTGTGHTDGFIFNIATTDGTNLFAMWIQKSGSGSSALAATSTDGGKTWSTTDLGPSDPNNDVAIGSISSSGSYGFAAWQYNAAIYFSSS
jgi:hypothetical protein